MTDLAFEPKTVAMSPGQKTMVVVRNRGTTEQSFSGPDSRVTLPNIAPGSTARIELAGANRVYRLLCTNPGHEDAGMIGEVRIQRR
jgi:uncharacterized cupredoxin-like copper-binding protein